MNMKKKIVTVCLVACMALTAVAGGTLAYFTDKEEATNTFTVGNVDIELTEDKWVENSKLMPGKTIEKDPTITVQSGSEDAYIFADITVGSGLLDLMEAEAGNQTTPVAELLNKWFVNVTTEDYKVFKSEENVDGSYTYLIGFKNAKSATQTIKLFDGIKVPETVNSKMLEKVDTTKCTLSIKATAIQKDGLEDIDAAQAALAQEPAELEADAE